MSDDEIKNLKAVVTKLEAELKLKNDEVMIYRQELIRFSKQLDTVMSGISVDTKHLTEIQKVLAPTHLPNIPGFEISRKFVYGTKSGGDYFDFFEFEDKYRFGVLVASSSGYSMSAMFLACILKLVHSLQAKRGTPPEELFQSVGEELKNQATANDQTHAFYAVVDRRNYSLRFCSVGKILGFYQSPNKPLQILKSSTSPFDWQFSGPLSSMEIELDPDSRLCLLTDGLSDVLGLEKISKILTEHAKSSVHEIRNELLFQAQRVSGLAEPTRDQTVVVLQVTGQIIKLAKP